MRELWFRELRPYSSAKIHERLGRNAERIIEKLMSANILKPLSMKKRSDEATIEDMMELAADGDTGYAFNFCGMVYVDNLLICCYPKYIRNGTQKKSFPLIMRVIERYEHHREQHIYSVQRGKKHRDMLGIIRSLLENYARHGLYRYNRHEYELNGQGETDWQRTIERQQPAFLRADDQKKPVYMNRYTDRVKTDEGNFFRQVHMAVLDECSQIIRKMNLQEFFPVRGIRFPGVHLHNLGSMSYILRRLRQEYARQFAEVRRQVLALLIIYVEQMASQKKNRPVVFFGTNAMNLVWEDALAKVLNNQLHEKIRDIKALPEDKRRAYSENNRTLIEIIEHPKWLLHDDENRKADTPTLMPDTIAINEHGFVIYDAKYYVPKIGRETISGQPGLESVTKQYLYQMAYREFLAEFGIERVKNVFLLPSEQNDKIATVEFQLLQQYTKNGIEAFFVKADDVWQKYVNGGEYDVQWMFSQQNNDIKI